MARHDIERMIAEALGNEDAETKAHSTSPRKPLPHGQQILDQYAKLWEELEAHQPEPSADVELPAAPEVRPVGSDHMIHLIVKKALARIKR